MNKEKKAQTVQFIVQQIKLENFNRRATRDLLRYYNKAKNATLREINTSIKRNTTHASKERLRRVYNNANKAIMELTDRLVRPISEAVGEAGAFSYKDTNRIISVEKLVVGYNNVSRSASQITAMVNDEKLGGKYLDDWLWSALRQENYALKAEVASGLLRGVGYKEIMKSLPSRYDNMLSSNTGARNIETVTKSYIQAVNAKAHKDIYEANRNIVKKVEWSAIMENGNVSTGRGTCPRCMALDGVEFKSIATGPPMPLHPRCRCMYLPVTKTWKELGLDVEETDYVYDKWYERNLDYDTGQKLPKKGGKWPRQVDDYGLTDKNYADWWMKRGKAFQDNAVGKDTAKLLKDKRLKFDQIIVRNMADRKRATKAVTIVNEGRRQANKEAGKRIYPYIRYSNTKKKSVPYQLYDVIHHDVLAIMYPKK